VSSFEQLRDVLAVETAPVADGGPRRKMVDYGGGATRGAEYGAAFGQGIGRGTGLVQWYPGHIASAERQLGEQLKRVDVVVEVRDARCPLATTHPKVGEWAGKKPRLVVCTRADQVTAEARAAWLAWFNEQGTPVTFVDARLGRGTRRVTRACLAVGEAVNARRTRRGLLARPVRVAVVGFPNVGKSALINRLVGRRVAKSAPRPGVTRTLNWVLLRDKATDSGIYDKMRNRAENESVQLLDSPGVLPPRLDDQMAAVRLAMCDDIGEAAYIAEGVAGVLAEHLRWVEGVMPQAIAPSDPLRARYGDRPFELADEYAASEERRAYFGERFIRGLAEARYHGDESRAAKVLLRDFRIGRLGTCSIEVPPSVATFKFSSES